MSSEPTIPLRRYVRYTFEEMSNLLTYLEEWGVDVSKLSATNHGEHISAETCRQVAEAISAHYHELSPRDQDWLFGHADAWRQLAERGGTWPRTAAERRQG